MGEVMRGSVVAGMWSATRKEGGWTGGGVIRGGRKESGTQKDGFVPERVFFTYLGTQMVFSVPRKHFCPRAGTKTRDVVPETP